MSTILIVDDTAVFREPIAAALRKRGYGTLCAAHGKAALEMIAQQRPDLILLDVAMPEMDGLTFLGVIRQDVQLRELPVILLTAMSEREAVVQAARMGVSDYLLKSHFSLADMLARVESCLHPQPVGHGATTEREDGTAAGALRRLAGGTIGTPPAIEAGSPASPNPKVDVLERLHRECGLGGMPPVMLQLMSLMNSARSDLADVASAIRMDPVLAARVMRVANAPYYAAGGQSTCDLLEAAQRIGFSGIRNIVMAITAMDHFPDMTPGGLIPQRFWDHSLGTAALAESLARTLTDVDPEQMFLSGLLHDLGRLALCTLHPERYRAVLADARCRNIDLCTAERENFGISHSSVTDELLRNWGLPSAVVEAACLHHALPERIARATRDARGPLIVALANVLAHALICGDSGDSTLLEIQTYADALALDSGTVQRIAMTQIRRADEMGSNYASQERVDFREPLWTEFAARIGPGVRVALVRLPNGFDPLALFLERLKSISPEKPTMVAMHVADNGPAESQFEELRLLDAAAGTKLPVLIASRTGEASLPEDAGDGREVRRTAIPGRYENVISAIAELASANAALAATA